MNLTPEQSAILSAVIERPGALLVTAADSPNDDVWRALVDRGMLEAVADFDEPTLRNMIELCSHRAYRLRPNVLQSVADFKNATHQAGTA